MLNKHLFDFLQLLTQAGVFAVPALAMAKQPKSFARIIAATKAQRCGETSPPAATDRGGVLNVAATVTARVSDSGSPDVSKTSSGGSIPSARATSLRVLVVDDNDLMLRATARLLRQLGYEVTTTDEAVGEIDAGRYDVALVDWQPLGPAAVDACMRSRTPFVVMSADPDSVPAELRLAVVSKPFVAEQLDAALSAACGVLP